MIVEPTQIQTPEEAQKRLAEIKQALENVKKSWGFDQVAPRAAKEGIDDVIWLITTIERLQKEVAGLHDQASTYELAMEDQTQISRSWMFSSIRANDKLEALQAHCAAVQALFASGESDKAGKELQEAIAKSKAPWTPPEE